MTETATFASRVGELVVIESPNVPIYEAGRQVGTKPGRRHQFSDHRCVVEGKRSIEYMRARAKAPDGPDIFEIDANDVPPTNVVLAELATADVERVREILADERDHADRQEVIAVAEAILDKAGASARKPGGQRHEVIAS